MLITALRALVLYIFVLVSMRIMGKREVRQLQPFEFVIALMMADLAATPMSDTAMPMLQGFLPLASLLIVHLMLSLVALKWQRGRELISGRSIIVVERGRVNEHEMKKLRYTLGDLMEQLHEDGYFSISDVEWAILETSGRLSILPRADKRTVQVGDLDIAVKREDMPWMLVMDGVVQWTNLDKCGRDINWLHDKLAEQGIFRPGDAFYAAVDEYGTFIAQARMGKQA